MKLSNLSKAALVGAVTLSLTALPFTLSASAQSSGSTSGSGTDTTSQGVDSTNRDRHTDWGWLGLLGLAGLAGLRSKRHEESTVYRETDASTRSGLR